MVVGGCGAGLLELSSEMMRVGGSPAGGCGCNSGVCRRKRQHWRRWFSLAISLAAVVVWLVFVAAVSVVLQLVVKERQLLVLERGRRIENRREKATDFL